MRCQTSEMGRLPKQPNHQLQDLLDEVRTSRKGFARRIVERGRTVGVELHYDHTSVGRWLAGEQPNPPGPMLIAEVLTELTGRRITPESSGMASIQDSPGLGLEFPLSLSEATAEATALWRSDVEQRRFLVGTVYAVAAYPAASIRWLTLSGPDHPTSAGTRRVGLADVDAVRTMVGAFRDLDNQVGGARCARQSCTTCTVQSRRYYAGATRKLLAANCSRPRPS